MSNQYVALFFHNQDLWLQGSWYSKGSSSLTVTHKDSITKILLPGSVPWGSTSSWVLVFKGGLHSQGQSNGSTQLDVETATQLLWVNYATEPIDKKGS